jgi:hypothetical protein
VDELVEKPDSEGVPIARGDPDRIVQYMRFMARNDVTEMTWRERTTAIDARLTRSASTEENAPGLKRLETARSAYARGDKATAFEIVTDMMKEFANK